MIDASAMWQKMRKSLGSKRKELSDDHIAEVTHLFGEANEVLMIDGSLSLTAPRSKRSVRGANEVLMIDGSLSLTAPRSKRSVRGANNDNTVPIRRIFKTTEFGYETITVERPLLDDGDKTQQQKTNRHTTQLKKMGSIGSLFDNES